MQKYGLIKLLQKMPEGTEFAALNWPLHVTLASNFVVDWDNTDLLAKLTELSASHKPVVTLADSDEHFGPQKQIHVTLLQVTPELQALHNDLIELLMSVGAVFDEPHYLKAGFRAHATVQPGNRLHKGDIVTIDNLTIVDMFPHGDISRRRLLQTIKLSA